MFKTVNHAQQWTAISGDLTNGFISYGITYATITTIAVSPIDTNIILAGTDDGNVWVSENNGGAWSKISDSLPDRWVTRVICDPHDKNTIYVTLSGYRFADDMSHVYQSTDLGATWQSISGNLPDVPANDLIIDPDLDSTLYLATDAGVFYTTNLGNEWFTLGYDLPAVPVTDLSFHSPTRKLVAATYGRSMFTIDLSIFTQVSLLHTPSFSINIFPAIAHDLFIVETNAEQSGDFQFSFLNEEGKVIWNSSIQKVQSGNNAFQFSSKEIFKDAVHGMVFLKTAFNGKVMVKKMILL